MPRRSVIGFLGGIIIVLTAGADAGASLAGNGRTVRAHLAEEWVEPLRSINSYGLFAVMTKERPEIVVEGSDDGLSWKPYRFRWKPCELDRRPRFTTPHMPRLDWQMWFAALSAGYRSHTMVPAIRTEAAGGRARGARSARATTRFPRDRRALCAHACISTRFIRMGSRYWWTREDQGPFLPARSSLADFESSSTP